MVELHRLFKETDAGSQTYSQMFRLDILLTILLSKIRHATSSNYKHPRAQSNVTAANAVQDLRRKTEKRQLSESAWGKSPNDTMLNNHHPKLEIFFLDSGG